MGVRWRPGRSGIPHGPTLRRALFLFMVMTSVTGFGLSAAAAEPAQANMAYDFQLINQDGQSVRLSDFRGKAVLVSYIFTRCPMPSMCPLVTSKMKQVQACDQQDRQRPGGAREHLV